MKKSAITRKLILSLASVALTSICLTSTTYAWFSQNSSAWTEDFQINLTIEEGLQISVDGVRFFDSIDNEQLLTAIAAKRLNKEYAAVTSEEVKETKVSFLPVTSKDLRNYSTIQANSPVKDEFYVLEDAPLESYAEFDLYFRPITSSGDAKGKYKLIFADSEHDNKLGVTKAEAEATTVQLNNTLFIREELDTRKLTPTLVKGKFEAGDSIQVNAKDAIRIGVRHHEDTEITIYEPNAGLGSVALKGIPDTLENKALYAPETNPMLTYFNSTHNIGKLDPLDYDDIYVNTEKDFEGQVSFGEFVRTDNVYNELKITVLLWLEGYDADYIEGVKTDSIHYFLNFTKVEVQEDAE